MGGRLVRELGPMVMATWGKKRKIKCMRVTMIIGKGNGNHCSEFSLKACSVMALPKIVNPSWILVGKIFFPSKAALKVLLEE
jgi:hypothetical protein